MAATAAQAMRTLLLRTACSLHPRRTRGNPKISANAAFRRLLGSPVNRAALCRERVSARVEAGLVSFGRSPARTGHGRVIDVGEVGEQVESESSIASLPCAVRCWR